MSQEIDYKILLIRYIDYIIDREGDYFIPDDSPSGRFSKEDMEELKKLRNYVRSENSLSDKYRNPIYFHKSAR